MDFNPQIQLAGLLEWMNEMMPFGILHFLLYQL